MTFLLEWPTGSYIVLANPSNERLEHFLKMWYKITEKTLQTNK